MNKPSQWCQIPLTGESDHALRRSEWCLWKGSWCIFPDVLRISSILLMPWTPICWPEFLLAQIFLAPSIIHERVSAHQSTTVASNAKPLMVTSLLLQEYYFFVESQGNLTVEEERQADSFYDSLHEPLVDTTSPSNGKQNTWTKTFWALWRWRSGLGPRTNVIRTRKWRRLNNKGHKTCK